MDWSNESYVRLYSRDTKTWILMGWQAHGIIGPMMRRLDRSGILEDVRDAEDLAAMLADGTPVEIVAAGLAAMIKHNVVVITEKGLLMTNFIEAQSASKSDKLRQKEVRESRRRESQNVTQESRNVTVKSRNAIKPSRAVTRRHEASQPVTLCCAVPSSAVPSVALPGLEDLPGSASAEPPAPAGYPELVKAYFVAFEARRLSKPLFGSREGKAVKALLSASGGNLAKARAIIESAYRDQFWGDKVTILEIVKDPSKFVGNSTQPAGRQHRPPQPNDETNRYVPPRMIR